MDLEIVDFNEDNFWSSEIDFDYEFDACRFFDFTRPESDAEAHQAESWFGSARSYPPSPFIVKLNWGKDFAVEVERSSSLKVEGRDNMNAISNNSDVDIDPEVSSSEMNTKGLKQQNCIKGPLKAKTKSMVKSIKPRSSTLLKPTASHLAKQIKAHDLNSSRWGRLQKASSKMDERSLQKSFAHEIEATKRQKLETGYLRKVAHLKQQNAMLHKIAKKVGQLDANSVYSRTKVTVPREPDLETAQRAQRRRSENIPNLTQHARPNAHAFKARPLNRKILQAPSLPLPKKSMPPVPEFQFPSVSIPQVFHLKTTERALQHQSANVLNSHNRNSALQGEDKPKARPLDKIFPSLDDEDLMQNRLPQNPPTDLFNKLSLKSDTVSNTISQSKQQHSTKGSKENAPSSFKPGFWRCAVKLNQCGNDRRIPEVGCHPNINRSLGIR